MLHWLRSQAEQEQHVCLAVAAVGWSLDLQSKPLHTLTWPADLALSPIRSPQRNTVEGRTVASALKPAVPYAGFSSASLGYAAEAPRTTERSICIY